jgi:hypothetical protein
LVKPLVGDFYSAANDQWATFQVDATDNLSMAKVEWYVDGALVGTSTVSPFIYKWFLSGHGGGPFMGRITTRRQSARRAIRRACPSGLEEVLSAEC